MLHTLFEQNYSMLLIKVIFYSSIRETYTFSKIIIYMQCQCVVLIYILFNVSSRVCPEDLI